VTRHSTGRIHIWEYLKAERQVVFNGHRSGVTALVFNAAATLLASGSRDTDVIVWDVVSESGLYRCVARVCVGSALSGAAARWWWLSVAGRAWCAGCVATATRSRTCASCATTRC
jgi:WD40 repeat protein